MVDRHSLKDTFLKQHNLHQADCEQIPTDASFRRYERLRMADNTYILMDAPPGKEEVGPFIKVANYLNLLNLSAPNVIASDEANGFILLEDLGKLSYNSYLTENNDNHTEIALYKHAIDLLVALHQSRVPDEILDYYDDEKLLAEAKLFVEWYVPILNGENLPAKLQEEYVIIWQHLLQYTRFLPDTVVLRDYHADNLMWLPEREGSKKVGLLDFQDAVVGSPVYDIVSLLEDARRDVHDDIAQAMITHYLTARPEIIRKDFLASYAILGVQRNLKIIGIFARKAARDKNSAYLRFLPRVWKYISKDLRHPLLLPLKTWIDKVVPAQIMNASNNANNLKAGVYKNV